MGKKMVLRSVLTVLLALSLASCATVDEKRQAASVTPDFSKAQPVLPLAPPPPPVIFKPAIENDPLENVYVSMDAVEQNLSSVLYMVAAETGLNLIIGPEINVNKPFTLTVKNMPAKEALEIICENAGVGYKISGSTIRVNAFTTKNYRIPYTTVVGDNTAVIGGNIFGSTGSDSGLAGDFKLSYSKKGSRADLHQTILGTVNAMIFPDTDETGQKTKGADQPAQPAQDGASAPAASGTGSKAAASAGSSSGQSSSGDTRISYYRGMKGYSFNTLTGMLTVTAPPYIIAMIDDYIAHAVKDASKQVLIEARIMEVTLSDASSYGINWTSENARFGVSLIGDLVASGTPVGYVKSYDNFFKFIATQGKIETLGNPRIRVLNGQSAMITSGQLRPFWEKKVDRDTENNEQTITYERSTVLHGITLGVTANIMEDNSVTLHVVPILTRIEDDTAGTYVQECDTNGNCTTVASYPKVNLKEAGTVLTVPNGSTIVMGGLIDNEEKISEKRIPILADIPGIGALFKAKDKQVEKRELVIMITTSLIDGNL